MIPGWLGCEWMELHMWRVGMLIGTAILENTLSFSYDVEDTHIL